MPTIKENLLEWDRRHDWPQSGDEWSSAWGGAEAQWYGAIFPRIHSFVPAGTILEIAPGYGRWTQMLKQLCERLVVVDLSESCIAACRRRFRSDAHITYHVNDGKSLAMIADRSIDFVFTFDSLVHAEADVIEAYLAQLALKLTPDGIGFVHHSNIGMYADRPTGKLPGYIANPHWRAESMTARRFKELCAAAGLQCISQELVNWGLDVVILNDCFSLLTPLRSVWARGNRVLINRSFMDEARHLSRVMKLYTSSSYTEANHRSGVRLERNT